LTNPEVTIAIPVYNGDQFIEKRIESIISQTYQNFQLIISDNASTDSTSKICKKFSESDTRISYIRQEKNIGSLENFNFLIRQASGKYFVWAAVDDFWLPEFLEKNVKILENNSSLVGSISKIQYFDEYGPISQTKKSDTVLRNYSYDNYPKSNDSEDLINFYLRLDRAENMYAVYRFNSIKGKYLRNMISTDKAIILELLKDGKIFIIDEILMHRYAGGMSTNHRGIDRIILFNSYGQLGFLFPLLPFTFWFIKNIGLKLFLKNINYFISKNLELHKVVRQYLKIKYFYKHGMFLPNRTKNITSKIKKLIETNQSQLNQLNIIMNNFSDKDLLIKNELDSILNNVDNNLNPKTFKQFLDYSIINTRNDLINAFTFYNKYLVDSYKILQEQKKNIHEALQKVKKLNEIK